ncbi:PAS domain S-box protein [Rhodospirillaceae bacterium KN72]|uniref:PAS domain S-box protein n=1 Tax=Pacificispira spongiicola TaxID=2729598 RepID=A0A7Y0DZK3_9PROT|nr:PAS domain S-box protein [Pacificispira spongiicola]NMM43756.1 PAS domain S-box protein [Pacificispira spongiicola]
MSTSKNSSALVEDHLPDLLPIMLSAEETPLRVPVERLLNNLATPIFIKNRDGYYVFVNDALCEALGMRPQDIVGHTPKALITDDKLDLILSQDRILFRDGGTQTIETPITLHDGSVMHVVFNKSAIFDDMGQVIGIVAVAYDVTARNLYRSELARKNEELTERIKELRCLYKITSLLRDTTTPIAEMLDSFLSVIPSAMLYPDDAQVRIVLGEQTRVSSSYDDAASRISATIKSDSGDVGRIDIAYANPHPEKFEGPFLKEECALLEEIAGKIGDRFQAEIDDHALAQSEARFRSTFEQAAVGICHLDANRRFLRANERLCRFWGYSDQELRQMAYDDLTFHEDVEEGRTLGAKLWSGALKHITLEKRYVRKDGQTVWGRVTASVVQHEDGTPRHFVAFVEDIDDARRVEDLHRITFDRAPIGICHISLDLRLLKCNPRFCKIHGLEPGTMDGKPLNEISPTIYQSADEEVARQLLAGEIDEYEGERYFVQTNGQTRWMRFTVTLVRHPDGSPNHFVCVVDDITDSKTSSEQVAELTGRLVRALRGTVEILSKTQELRDPYTAGHQNRVAKLAVAIARRLKLDTVQLQDIEMGAMIHDIGKLMVPSDLLNKPGRLTPEELALIKTHARLGADLVMESDISPTVVAIVRYHHERLDGTGYPDGLAGEAIPIEARIVAVSDVVEAITSHRPYRPGRGLDVAIDEIKAGSGTIYDTQVVDACLAVLESESPEAFLVS